MLSIFLKFKDLFFKNIKSWDLQSDPSAQKLATMNALNRRKNMRIRYPHIGPVGDLPKIYYQSEEMIVGNISTGGLLIIDDNEKLGGSLGAYVHFDIIWPDAKVQAKAQVVGAQFQRRHIQFIDFNPTAFVRISQMIKPGFLGSRFHIIRDKHSMLDAEELWVGPTGESLLFPKSTQVSPIIFNSGSRNLIIDQTKRPFWDDNNEAITKSQLSDLLVMLANFPESTTLVKSLIEHLQTHYELKQFLKTGTGG